MMRKGYNYPIKIKIALAKIFSWLGKYYYITLQRENQYKKQKTAPTNVSAVIFVFRRNNDLSLGVLRVPFDIVSTLT